MDSAAASEALRNGMSPELRHRRAVAALSLVSATSMGVISLYQTGLVKHLPEPPLGLFDADRVDAAADAYPLGVPDATLGLVSYGVTLAPRPPAVRLSPGGCGSRSRARPRSTAPRR